MKKFFSLIAAVLFAGSMMAEAQVDLHYTGTTTVNMVGDGANNAALVGLDETMFTVLSDKGKASNHVGLNKAGDIRLYAHKDSGNGCTLTVNIAEGTILSIALDIKQSATFVVKAGENVVTEAGGSYAINASSFSIQNTTTGATTQLQLNKITIVHDGEGGDVPVVYDTLSVAEAIAIADTLEANKNSDKYYIEGYAANVAEYSYLYKNQEFYLVADTTAPDSVLKVFRATPMKENVAYPVLAGDKVRLFGQLLKYVKDTTTAPQLQVYCPTVEFLEEVEGDRTIPEPQVDTITVARALAIGDSIGQGKTTGQQYVIEGFVTALTDNSGNPTTDGGWSQYKNQCMWVADSLDEAAITKDKAFFIYQGVAPEQVTKGAKIRVTCAIKNYNGMIETAVSKGAITILAKGEDPEPPAVPDTISVDSALVIGSALASGKSTEKTYAIVGYVSKIDQDQYSTDYKSMTFWITSKPGSDAATNAEGAFEVFRGKPDRQLAVGNKILATTQIQKYTNGVIESITGCPVLFLEQGEVPEYDTLTVAMAKDMADALPANVLSEKKYYVIGYAANVSEYDSRYPYQDFYMVTDTTAQNTELQAFHAVPTKDNVATPVLAGDKVCLFGALQKFVADSSSAPQLQVVNPKAEILEAVEGDRTIPEPKWDKITVAQALEIGTALEDGGVTSLKYEITGYVSFIASLYNSSTKKENFWIADSEESQASSNADGAFYVYGGMPNNEQELGLGAKVTIVTTIKKYVSKGVATIENDKAVSVEVLEQGELVVDTLSVEEAKAEALKLAQNQTGAKFYAVKGFIHKVKEAYSTQYKNASFYISDDLNETETDVYCYHASLNEADASKVAVGSYVIVTGHLMHNFYNNVSSAQIPTGSAIFTEAPAPVELEPITVAEALEIAKALAPEAGATVSTKDKYAVKAYVIKIDEDEEWYSLADDPEAESSEFRATEFSSTDAEVNEGDLVILTGKIQAKNNQYGGQTYYSYYMEGAVLIHHSAEGIQHVVLTEKVQKLMIDGAIYIIRNGKMYDLRGAQVR